MATNKHAVIRYQALDRCFSNFGCRFYIDDLIKACGQAIYDFSGSFEGVQRRQIFEDIKFMESEQGYAIPLDKHKDGRKVYYRYQKKNYSISSTPISQAEVDQLKHTILMLSRFKGLPQFNWISEVLARFEDTFNLKSNVSNVVSFEQNIYLKGIEHFTDIFNAIINKQVLSIAYNRGFKGVATIVLHPYHLKQYNNRWFLFGLCVEYAERIPIMNLGIDRIESLTPTSDNYIENNIDFEEYFDDIVGVTVLRGVEVERIVLRIDIERYNYIEAKPIHHSQTVKEKTESYVVIELELKLNYEFETLLLGFADDIEIIEPISLKEKIRVRANRVLEKNI